MSTNGSPSWRMAGDEVGSCNCDWGCPCNFDAPPTYGHCDGFYAQVIREGRYGNVPLCRPPYKVSLNSGRLKPRLASRTV